MNWTHIVPIAISAASIVLSGLTIKWSRQAAADWKETARLMEETKRLREQRLRHLN